MHHNKVIIYLPLNRAQSDATFFYYCTFDVPEIAAIFVAVDQLAGNDFAHVRTINKDVNVLSLPAPFTSAIYFAVEKINITSTRIVLLFTVSHDEHNERTKALALWQAYITRANDDGCLDYYYFMQYDIHFEGYAHAYLTHALHTHNKQLIAIAIKNVYLTYQHYFPTIPAIDIDNAIQKVVNNPEFFDNADAIFAILQIE